MSGVAVNGVERSALNKLYHGAMLRRNEAGGHYWYYRDGDPWVREDDRLVERLQRKGLVSAEGGLTELGRTMISIAQRYR